MGKELAQLEQDTIIETWFEIRFKSTLKNASDVLPGLIFSELRGEFSSIEPLPIWQLPADIRQSDPSLRNRHTHRLIRSDGRGVYIGENVVSLNVSRPYPGWDDLKVACKGLADALSKTDLVESVERSSLKYSNVIPVSHEAQSQLDALKVELKIAGKSPLDRGMNLRMEFDRGACIAIVEVRPNVQVSVRNTSEEFEGVLVAIDVLKSQTNKFFTDVDEELEEIHLVEKGIYVDLLSEETLKSLGPIWR